jgi:HEAT repeat protein
MKSNRTPLLKIYHRTFVLFIGAVTALSITAKAEITNIGNVIASVRTNDLHSFQVTATKFHDERKNLIMALLSVFNDSSASNLNQCAAAYYLGEVKAAEAVDALAAKITLQLNIWSLNIHALPIIPKNSAMEALIKIGDPSIPAVIRNLADSDDAQVRKLSLQVLVRIDGDKDITQLRLQKALKAQTDSQKQARLQSALKALAAI